jgi:hypothetical protein
MVKNNTYCGERFAFLTAYATASAVSIDNEPSVLDGHVQVSYFQLSYLFCQWYNRIQKERG